VLGLVFNDIMFRSVLTPVDRAFFIQRLGAIDWSRHNPDWINMLGQPETDDSGNVIADSEGRPRVALGKAGANTIRSLIKYAREKTEIERILNKPEEPEVVSKAEEPEVVAA
jgi:hypothetical protein